jgi:hypothetical protein
MMTPLFLLFCDKLSDYVLAFWSLSLSTKVHAFGEVSTFGVLVGIPFWN